MPDPEPTGPRLVRAGEDRAEKPPVAQGSDSAPGRVRWLVIILLVAALAGLVAQTLRARALQDANEELTGELFATRSALDAYVERFAAVRESFDGIQAQFEQLGALVSSDPLAPPEPKSGTEPVAEPGY